jgi:hypothetical protein
MNDKTLLYLGIAAAAYYIYTQSKKPFEFTPDELQKIQALAKGNPIKFVQSIKIVLTPSRYAEFIESENKKKMAQ